MAVIGGCEGSAVLAVVELNTKVISRIVWLCAVCTHEDSSFDCFVIFTL